MVWATPFRIVLDTNILVRGILNDASPSGRILLACEQRRHVPLLSKPVLSEYRAILTGPDLVERYPQLESRRTRVVLERLMYLADMIQIVGRRFDLPRDPKDAKLVELSIAGHATHLITTDKDLLDLAHGRGEAAVRLRRRLPGIVILKPHEFVRIVEGSGGGI